MCLLEDTPKRLGVAARTTRGSAGPTPSGAGAQTRSAAFSAMPALSESARRLAKEAGSGSTPQAMQNDDGDSVALTTASFAGRAARRFPDGDASNAAVPGEMDADVKDNAEDASGSTVPRGRQDRQLHRHDCDIESPWAAGGATEADSFERRSAQCAERSARPNCVLPALVYTFVGQEGYSSRIQQPGSPARLSSANSARERPRTPAMSGADLARVMSARSKPASAKHTAQWPAQDPASPGRDESAQLVSPAALQ
ncbi:hypothetical protein V8E36_000168 [Tilletia maclaganii]